mgnify:CR=1 FL=1
MARHSKPEDQSVRLLKVGERVRHILSELLARGEAHDDILRAHNISVTEVRMSPDLRNAKVYVKPLLGEDEDVVVKALRTNTAFFQREVAQRLGLWRAAHLRDGHLCRVEWTHCPRALQAQHELHISSCKRTRGSDVCLGMLWLAAKHGWPARRTGAVEAPRAQQIRFAKLPSGNKHGLGVKLVINLPHLLPPITTIPPPNTPHYPTINTVG